MQELAYDPAIFNVTSLAQAKSIILTPDGKRTPEERWSVETEYLLEKIIGYMPIVNSSCLDYGCGIGRLARPLIARRNWTVLGVDISPSMRRLAVEYVDSDRFLCCAPIAFERMCRFGARFDFALSVWALQHMAHVKDDIARIAAALKPGGRLFVLNARQRFVPTRQAWMHDGADVLDLLTEALIPVRIEGVDESIIPGPPSYWGVWEAPP
jgi:2-polyprenyl-3-methyl-5-hydroxy-6-metoxy-1,4-benzoquinol methylase